MAKVLHIGPIFLFAKDPKLSIDVIQNILVVGIVAYYFSQNVIIIHHK